jgi:hypothetical protein
MAARRPNRRAIKQHYSYTFEEAARVLGVSKGTVRRWMKDGLPCITDQRPFLILGADLRNFLDRRNRSTQTCRLHECFCFRCRKPKAPAAGMVDYTSRTTVSGKISAICEECGTLMHKAFSAANLPRLVELAEVSFPQGEPCLSDRTKLLRNDHFRKEPMA